MTLKGLWRRGGGTRTSILAAILFAMPMLATACAGAASAPLNDAAAPVGRPATDEPRLRDGDQARPDDALIVRTGQVQLEVAELDPALVAGRQAIEALGGYVELSEERHGEDEAWAQVTYRLPVEHWQVGLTAIRQLGEVVAESTDARDVTAEVVDLDARLQNLQATEAALQSIMQRAETIEDVLAVQRELTEVRGEIEQLTARRDHLASQAAMSTLTVTYQVSVAPVAQAAGGWDLGREVESAVAALVVVLQRLASFGIWLVIVIAPVVAPVLLIGWLVYRLARRRTRPA